MLASNRGILSRQQTQSLCEVFGLGPPNPDKKKKRAMFQEGKHCSMMLGPPAGTKSLMPSATIYEV